MDGLEKMRATPGAAAVPALECEEIDMERKKAGLCVELSVDQKQSCRRT